MEQLRLPRWFVVLIGVVVAGLGTASDVDRCSAQPLTLHEGPAYDGATGYLSPSFHNDDPIARPQASWALLNDAGTATWFADFVPSTVNHVALRYNPTSGPAVQLGDLAPPPVVAASAPYAINVSGTIVGRSADTRGRGRPVRWDAAGTTPMVLEPLEFFALLGAPSGQANDINDSGLSVGWSGRTHPMFIADQGDRAVRWDATGEVTELANISSFNVDSGMESYSVATSEAYAINNLGTTVGYGTDYIETGENKGQSNGHRAVRWDAAGAATELGHLGTSMAGITSSEAWAINEVGDAVGFATKFDGQGLNDGQRAVRWNSGSTAAVELQILGTDPAGATISKAYTLNEAGTAVGWLDKWDNQGVSQGTRAVLWNAAGQVTELGLLAGASFSQAFDINDSGIAVGSSGAVSPLAVYWGTDGTPVDLNTLIAPTTAWVLQRALAISNTGWIAGIGKFDDGAGGAPEPYDRVFMLQLPADRPLAGDYNDDGNVDAADYAEWRDKLDTNTTLPNDTTPGSVVQADYDVWRANFGATEAQAAALGNASVPEPATLALAALSLIGLNFCLCPRRRAHRRD